MMMKLILMASALVATDSFSWIDLSTLSQLGDYAIALLISLLMMPWVTQQFDS